MFKCKRNVRNLLLMRRNGKATRRPLKPVRTAIRLRVVRCASRLWTRDLLPMSRSDAVLCMPSRGPRRTARTKLSLLRARRVLCRTVRLQTKAIKLLATAANDNQPVPPPLLPAVPSVVSLVRNLVIRVLSRTMWWRLPILVAMLPRILMTQARLLILPPIAERDSLP